MSLRLVLATICLLLTTGLAIATELSGQVTWVYDGDTLLVEGIGKVRLLGIDTPETKASERDRYYQQQFSIPTKQLRKIARMTKQFNIRQVKGKRVTLITDRQQRDRYGRLLAYVYLPNKRLLNSLLLEKGWASVYRRFNFQQKKTFLATEKTARRARIGLWQL